MADLKQIAETLVNLTVKEVSELATITALANMVANEVSRLSGVRKSDVLTCKYVF